MHTTALAVFCFFFLLVTLAGFWAARWRRPLGGIASLEEWGLAGRSFGTLVTWFLLGGDLYTAYTVIAVPAALYGAGALGFFALPYAILAYPYMMVVMPRIWRVCHRHGYVTLADFVGGRYGFRPLTVAVALTGILSLMPYIALQLVGMRVVIAAMGVHGEWPLVAAFLILAAYTYSSGLRAPAVIAIVKDLMLYVMVLAAIIVLPLKLGGYAHIFALANQALATHTPASTIALRPAQSLPYISLACGSAIALMLYPHTATAVMSARSANTSSVATPALLPAYSFLLGLIALLGYVALAAGVHTKRHQPRRSRSSFSRCSRSGSPASASPPSPSAPSFPRPSCPSPPPISSPATSTASSAPAPGRPREESQRGQARQPRRQVRRASLRPPPARSLRHRDAAARRHLDRAALSRRRPAASFTRWFQPGALLAGWAAGMASGTAMAVSLGLKSSVFPLAPLRPELRLCTPRFRRFCSTWQSPPPSPRPCAASRLRPAHDTTDPAAYTG